MSSLTNWIQRRVENFVDDQRRKKRNAVRVLAEGDSWFTYGAWMWGGMSLIEQLNRYQTVNIVSLAQPERDEERQGSGQAERARRDVPDDARPPEQPAPNRGPPHRPWHPHPDARLRLCPALGQTVRNSRQPHLRRPLDQEKPRKKGTEEDDEQREIVNFLIDEFNKFLDAWQADVPHFVHLDLRGTLKATDWADEIHPTAEGRKELAKKFREKLVEVARH